MGTFADHIKQSENNLDFLHKVNSAINDRWDWQVTICFYSALHMVNAHIVAKTGMNYLSHNQVSDVLNPYNTLSVARLDEDTFLSYNKLFQLSRRSRYLLNENYKKENPQSLQPACITYDRHFKKAIHHLDKVISFVSSHHKVKFPKFRIECIELKGSVFANFEV